MKILQTSTAAGLLLAGLSAAHAASLGLGAGANVNLVLPGDSQSYSSSDPAQVASTHTVSASITGYGSTSNSWMQGTAGHFAMQSYSLAADPAANGCGNCGVPVSQASDSGGFTDSLLLSSATLATGAPVDLLLTLNVSASFSASQAPSQVLTSVYSALLFAAAGTQGASLSDDGPGGSPDVFSIVLHTAVGQTVSLNALTAIGTYAEYSDQTERSISQQAQVDYYVDTLTAGVALQSTSGHDYATPPVPEPATWLMLGLGLPLLALRRRAERR